MEMQSLLWFSECFGPLYFSNVQASPHERPNVDVREIPIFFGDGDSTLHHFSRFIKLCKENNIIYEDYMMMSVAVYLKNNAELWFKITGKKQILSFLGFLEAFYKRWSFYHCSLFRSSRYFMKHKRFLVKALYHPLEIMKLL
jgi:hypothetical protein